MTKRLTTEQFIERSLNNHIIKYDYTMVKYINGKTKVKIKCCLHDFIFVQLPGDHMNGKTGCTQCHRDAAKTTMLNKYGVEYSLQLSKFKNKRLQTMLEIYGTDNTLSNLVFNEKKKQTMIKRYGVEHATQSIEIQEKIKQTNIRKYGVEHVLQCQAFREKGINTNNVKYGVSNHTQKHFTKSTMQKLKDKSWLIHQHHIKHKTLRQIALELGISSSTVSKYFKDYNIAIKFFSRSQGEIEIFEFITQLGYDALANSRDIIHPYEIDIFIPKLKIGVEYNGEYWHKTTQGRDKIKFDMCKKQNITLITIWDFEWLKRKLHTKERIFKLLKM